MAGMSQFLVHVDFGAVRGDVVLEKDAQDWKVVYAGLDDRRTWTQGKLGFWEWDTGRDACLLFDDRAKRSPGIGGTIATSVGLSAGNSPYIAVGLFGFNPKAATFGYSGVAAWGSDYGRGLEGGALRGTWEIVAKPEDMAFVRAELENLHAEIEREYRNAALDAIGIVDPTPISDLLGAGMAIAAADYVGASLSLVSVLPYLGDLVGKTAKATRLALKLKNLYLRLRRVMNILQVLEERAARARKAARAAMERAERLREKAVREARAARARAATAFREAIKRKYAHVAAKAGWSTEDLARACHWCKFTEPPKIVVARKRGKLALKYEGKAGYAPKPMDVKLKSSKRPPNEGLVVMPTEADLADIARREGPESVAKMRKNIKELQEKGYTFDASGALLDPQKRKIYSDVDYMGIYNVPAGRQASAWGGTLIDNDDPFFIDWINNLFHGKAKAKQHGNQDRLDVSLFSKDKPRVADDFAKDVNTSPGRLPDADELVDPEGFLLIGPDGIPRTCSWAEVKDWYRRYGIPDPYAGHH
ncbi:MAG: hypothetical protein IPK81_17535 [Rhodospirillales bacterium]|nr:MAG: hypothetical protein IPK81_17535 [Rhodospirillales bacterium]